MKIAQGNALRLLPHPGGVSEHIGHLRKSLSSKVMMSLCLPPDRKRAGWKSVTVFMGSGEQSASPETGQK